MVVIVMMVVVMNSVIVMVSLLFLGVVSSGLIVFEISSRIDIRIMVMMLIFEIGLEEELISLVM